MGKRSRKRYLFTSEKARECQLISTEARRLRKAEFLATQYTAESTEEHVIGLPRYNLRDRTAIALSSVSVQPESDSVEQAHIDQQDVPHQDNEYVQIEAAAPAASTPTAPKPRRVKAKKPSPSPVSQSHHLSVANQQYSGHQQTGYSHLEEEESEEEARFGGSNLGMGKQGYPYPSVYAPHDNYSLYQPQTHMATMEFTLERERVSQYASTMTNTATAQDHTNAITNSDKTYPYHYYNTNSNDPSASSQSDVSTPASRPSSSGTAPSPSFSYASSRISNSSLKRAAKLAKKNLDSDFQRNIDNMNELVARAAIESPDPSHSASISPTYSFTTVSASTLSAQSSMRNAPMNPTSPHMTRMPSPRLENALFGLELDTAEPHNAGNMSQYQQHGGLSSLELHLGAQVDPTSIFTPVPTFNPVSSPVEYGLALPGLTSALGYLDDVNMVSNTYLDCLDDTGAHLAPGLSLSLSCGSDSSLSLGQNPSHHNLSHHDLGHHHSNLGSEFTHDALFHPSHYAHIASHVPVTPSAPLFDALGFDNKLNSAGISTTLALSRSSDTFQSQHHQQQQLSHHQSNSLNSTHSSTHPIDTIPPTSFAPLNPLQQIQQLHATDLLAFPQPTQTPPKALQTQSQATKLSQLNNYSSTPSVQPLVGNVTTTTGAQVEDFFASMPTIQPLTNPCNDLRADLRTDSAPTKSQQPQQPTVLSLLDLSSAI